ncbi:MAG: universal stress protein [Spirochaetota bacterium]|nr:universal stress protein [Spirochaetota bacterium]
MKKIIVGIDGSKESFNSYKCASTLFLGEDISLTSVFVQDERKTQIPFIYSGAAYDIAYERLYLPVDPQLAKTYEKLKEENKIFADKCIKICEKIELGDKIQKSGIILEGDPAEELIEVSEKFDLMVLGQRGENASYARELIGSTSEDVIRKSLVPVLICPGNTVNLKKILIVYEDCLSSENAINYYIKYLSSNNTNLTILVKDHFNEISTGFYDKVMKLKTSERRISIEHCKGSLAHRAIEMMEEGIIDTFVLGSHGKHKLAEYLLGSVTVHIIRKSSLPVFIVH